MLEFAAGNEHGERGGGVVLLPPLQGGIEDLSPRLTTTSVGALGSAAQEQWATGCTRERGPCRMSYSDGCMYEVDCKVAGA